MTSDGVKTDRTKKWLKGWSTAVGIVNFLISAYLAYKGQPEVAAGFGLLGMAKVAQPDEPIGKFGL